MIDKAKRIAGRLQKNASIPILSHPHALVTRYVYCLFLKCVKLMLAVATVDVCMEEVVHFHVL